MSMGSSFLGGAGGRLLPASVPFRFFVTACVFQVVAWVVVGLGADEIPGFVGGPGLALAALHLFTLGVLAMTAMGAAFQLLPVATRKVIPSVGLTKTAYYLYVPAVAVLTVAMAEAHVGGIILGSIGATLGLLVFAVVVAGNLVRGRDLALVTAHGWTAVAALVLAVGFAVALAFDFHTGFLPDHGAIAIAHGVAAVFGFMGMLAFGFSYVLIPMFALSRISTAGYGRNGLAAAIAAIVVTVGGLIVGATPVVAIGLAAGAIAAAFHLRLMVAAMTGRMRKRLGVAFVLIRFAWVALAAGLVLALAVTLGVPIPNGATFVGFLLIGGWLLTLLLGVLQKIMPFLASMHTAQGGGGPVRVTQIAPQMPLTVAASGHFAALAAIGFGILADSALAVRLGAVAGAVGAMAFLVFALSIARHLRRGSGGDAAASGETGTPAA